MKWLRRFFAVVLACAALLAGVMVWTYLDWSGSGPLTEEKTVLFPRGMGVREIGDKLQQEGVIRHAESFLLWSVFSRKHHLLKAGEYAFPAAVSAENAAQMIADGKTVIRKVTIPEGLSVVQILSILSATQGLEGDVTTQMQEGELLPETYFYSYGDRREDLVQRMRRDMRAVLAAAWENKAQGLPFKTPEEALTLASIVEKETGVKDERPRVAAVYINRLRKGMLLQADPTVLYGLTQGRYDQERLLLKDLESTTPYNTYKYAGLPPGPIANPGKASIEAVLNPLTTDEYYFVADGKGGHLFATTLAEHAKNVELYRAWQRAQGMPK